jgi:hypothetical protein
VINGISTIAESLTVSGFSVCSVVKKTFYEGSTFDYYESEPFLFLPDKNPSGMTKKINPAFCKRLLRKLR